MKDLGIYLIALSIPFFILYFLSLILTDGTSTSFNLNLIAAAHAFNGLNVYFLWQRFIERTPPEDVLDDGYLPSSKHKRIPKILPNLLFPLGFLVSLGALTYMAFYIFDHSNYQLEQWFDSNLLVTFTLACSVPAALISIAFYYRLLMSQEFTQSH
ncbi:MAG: hypothetical protein P8L71_07995 [Flavobacteriales bacterium]|nr:hypothetical protein [Flavobacteriales bacterium]